MLKRALVLPVLLIALALALAACGSSDSGGDDEGQITATIRTVATGTNASNCTKLETQAFAEQSAQSEGKEAVKQCEEKAPDATNNPKSVTISKVEVDGSEATADTSFVGGGFDGQTATIALVKDGDQWKLDEIARFAKFDRTRLVEQFEVEFEDPSNEVKKNVADCLVKALNKTSQAEFEVLLLGNSPKPIEELTESCS